MATLKRQKIGFQDQLSLFKMQVKTIAECSKGEHFAILSAFIKLPFVIKIFVLSIFEWPFYTGFTVLLNYIPVVIASPVHSVHFIHLRVLPILDG